MLAATSIRPVLIKVAEWIYLRPASVFALIAVVFGTAGIFQLAPLNGTDEFTHFPRAYQVSQGIWWEQPLGNDPQGGQQYGGQLPANIAHMVDDYRDLSRNSDYRQYEQRKAELQHTYTTQHIPGKSASTENFTSVVVYPPWAYAPSVVGILMARVARVPLIWYVYLGRFTTLLAWTVLTWGAIRLLPQGKWFLVAVALLPSSLTQAATIGADGLLNGLSWLLIALFLAILANRKPVRATTLALASAACVGTSVIKVAYWPLATLAFLIPNTSFRTPRQAVAWKLSLGCGLAVLGGWFAWHTNQVAKNTVLTPRDGQYINSHAQALHVLQHPFTFGLRALTQPFSKDYDAVYQGLVGILTSRTVYLSLLVMVLLYAGLFISLLDARVVARLREHRMRLLLGFSGIFIITQLLLSLTFYLANTQVGAVSIFGVYGRYFLPVLPLFVVLPLTLRMPYRLQRLSFMTAVAVIIFIGISATLKAIG